MMRAFACLLFAGTALGQQVEQHGVIQLRSGRVTVTQPNATQQPEYTGPKGSISGTVVDSATGAPVRKAMVFVPGLSAVTDGSGSFTFDQLPPGTYQLWANHLAYPQVPNSGPVLAAVTLGPGEQKRGLEVKLTPGITVSGRVTDEDNDPVPGCQLFLFPRNVPGIHFPAMTNREGDYTIANAPAGKYYLEASCRAPVLQPRAFALPDALPVGRQLGYAARYYPGVADLTGAQRIAFTPGQQARGFDFRIASQPVFTVIVRIAGISGEKLQRVMVSLLPQSEGPRRDGAQFAGSLQPRTGIARIASVPQGRYRLQVVTYGAERLILVDQAVEIGEETRELTVQAMSPVSLSGTIHTEAPPSTRQRVPGQIWLSYANEQGLNMQTELQPDGTFLFKALTPGRYRLQGSVPGFVQSITLGGETFEGAEFELKPGASGPLEVTVSSATGSLSGEVQVGAAKPAQILLLAHSPGNTVNNLVPSGQPAKFSLTLPPGHYELYAVETNGRGLPNNLLSGEPFTGRGEPVDIRAGSESVKNLKLITLEEIEKAEQ